MKKAGLAVLLVSLILLILCSYACAAGDCDHNWVTATIGMTYVAEAGNDGTHTIKKEMEIYCDKCSQVLTMWTDETTDFHRYSGGVCTLCSHACSHSFHLDESKDVYEKYSSTEHKITSTYGCVNCDASEQRVFIEPHAFTNDVCVLCKYARSTATCSHTFKNGVCTKCGYACTHPACTYNDKAFAGAPITVVSTNTQSHTVVAVSGERCYTCSICKYEYDYEVIDNVRYTEAHTYTPGGNVCLVCNYVSSTPASTTTCKHDLSLFPDTFYVVLDSTSHEKKVTRKCSNCKASILESDTIEAHTFNYYGVCTRCEYDKKSGNNPAPTATQKATPTPTPKITPVNCNHTYQYGKCTKCGYECPHPSKTYMDTYFDGTPITVHSYNATSHDITVVEGDRYWTCTVCKDEFPEIISNLRLTENHRYGSDGKTCFICGYKKGSSVATPTPTKKGTTTPVPTNTPKASGKGSSSGSQSINSSTNDKSLFIHNNCDESFSEVYLFQDGAKAMGKQRLTWLQGGDTAEITLTGEELRSRDYWTLRVYFGRRGGYSEQQGLKMDDIVGNTITITPNGQYYYYFDIEVAASPTPVLTATPIPTATPTPTATPAPSVTPWWWQTATPVPTATPKASGSGIDFEENQLAPNIIILGSYEQDGDLTNGPEPIEWIVLERNEDVALVVSKYVLSIAAFDSDFDTYTWCGSDLAYWLNYDFFDEVFSNQEKDFVCDVYVPGERSGQYDTDQGEDCICRVFLLSTEDAELYFNTNDERICFGTESVLANQETIHIEGACNWWLKTLGHSGNNGFAANVTYVDTSGAIEYYGIQGVFKLGVRPAMVVRTN